MKENIIKSVLIYLGFFILIYLFYKIGILAKLKIYLILGFVFIFIKDILFFLYENKPQKNIKNDFKKIYKDLEEGKVTQTYFFLFLNRNYFFPFILVIYLILLLIGQTHIFNLDKINIIKNINNNFILSITIFSGILTIFQEEKDKKYQKVEKKDLGNGLNILLTIFLSIFGTYIIFLQVIKLGFLSYPISIISGILIFLVGISILEDNENNLFNNN